MRLFKHFFWLFPFLSFMVGYISFDRLYKPTLIEVPTLVGKSIEDAFIILSKNNLNARLIAVKEDEALAHGTIISQTPSSGKTIKQQQSVFLVIATKPEKKRASSFYTKSIEEIEKELNGHKIGLKVCELPSSYAKGQCFAQFPEPGQTITDNYQIIYVSQGKVPMMLMPDLKGQSLAQVKDALSDYPVGISISYLDGGDQEDTRNYEIADQRPLPGSILNLDIQRPLNIQLQVKR